MKEKISIRFIQNQDMSDLLAIENSVWTAENAPVIHHHASLEEYQEKMAEQIIFVATDQHKVLGFIDVHHPTHLIAHQKQWVLVIAVAEEAQSKGVGKMLLNYVKKIAKEDGIHKLTLRVMATNQRAIQFYQKNGFRQEAHFKDEFFIDDAFCDDYQFAYFIEKS